MESTEAEDRCLICDSVELPLYHLADRFPLNDNFVILAGGGKVSGNNTNRSVSQQLPVIFLLRTVLRVNKDFLGSVLQSTGTNPSLWNLKLCRSCYRFLEEADFVFTRLTKLHLEFDELSKVLCTKIVQSVKSKSKSKVLQRSEEIKPAPKRRGRKGKRRKVLSAGSAVCDANETHDGAVTVSNQIRKEIASQACDMHGESEGVAKLFENVDLASRIIKGKGTNHSLNTRTSNPSQTSCSTCLKVMKKVEFAAEVEHETTEEFTTRSSRSQTKQVISGDNVMEDDNNATVEDMDSDIDFESAPEPDPDWGEDEDNQSAVDHESMPDDSDSDFEPVIRPIRNRSSKKTTPQVNKNRGIILKAIKMENTNTYSCPKCQAVFGNASLCDEHILNKHYGGTWPQKFSCHLCEDINFKGEHWLRYHYRMRHPGVIPFMYEALQRSIEEGTMPELTYEVVPVGQAQAVPSSNDTDISQLKETTDSEFVNRTVNEPVPNCFNIPVVIAGGHTRYLVLSNVMKRLPKDALTLIEPLAEEKLCKMCGKKFPTELQFQAHVKRTHEGDQSPYCCPLCPKKYERIGKLLIGHMKKIHVLSRYPCYKCGYTFKEEILYTAHIQRNHFGIDNPYKCIKCSLRYPRRSALNNHLKKFHKLQIASYFVEKRRKSKPGMAKGNLGRGMKKKKLERKFSCKICIEKGQLEMKFASEEELDIHTKRRHLGISRPYPCPICQKRYSKPAKVEVHMKTHTVRSDLAVGDEPPPELPVVCGPCNKQFKSRAVYNAHLKGRYHQDVRPFVCELCSKGFRELKYLQNHQTLKHHNELNIDPHQCKFCDKVLGSARTLDNHIRMTHTKNAKFKCPYCDIQFQHKSQRDYHVNAAHTKTQHFLCPQCPKTFLKEFYLKYHTQRCHSGEKPYECKFCFKRFSDKSTFNRHVEEHSGKVHSCPECGKSGFKTRHALRVHRKTFHKEFLDQEDESKKIIVRENESSQDTLTRDETLPTTVEEPCSSETATANVEQHGNTSFEHVKQDNQLESERNFSDTLSFL